jgi:hypothetical protein
MADLPKAETGFGAIINRTKTSLAGASSNSNVRAVIKPILDASERLLKRIDGYIYGGTDIVNPFATVAELWAPRSKLARTEYKQAAEAMNDLASYYKTVPKNDLPPDAVTIDTAKTKCIQMLAVIETLKGLPGINDNRWQEWFANFSTDCANAIPLFMKGVLKVTDAVLDHVVKPAIDGAENVVWHVLKRVFLSLWWLILVIVAVVTAPYWMPVLTATVAAKVVT